LNSLRWRDRLLKQISTLWFIGYLPVAPGTWGSLAGCLLIFIIRPAPAVHAILLLLVSAAGIWSSTVAERVMGARDSSHIVIDEFAGILASTLMLPHTPAYLLAAFILFRFFDILKPFPVSYLERTLSRGQGVMADDLAAGIISNLLLQAWIRI